MSVHRELTAAQLRRHVEEQLRAAGVQSGNRIVAAVSGGLDSMVLLHILVVLAEEGLSLDLHVAHLDHQLRPEAESDSRFVAEAAAAIGLSCTNDCADVAVHAVAHGLSIEEAGRDLRRQFFESVCDFVGGDHIALGHHANDQAETVLMRLLRGCGTAGLSAMTGSRKRYLRPLLKLTKAHLEEYAHSAGVKYRQDQSNFDLRFTRNRVRHKLIPLLEREYNPNLIPTLGRSAEIWHDDDDALHKISQHALETTVYARSPNTVILAVPSLLRYHIAVQRRVLREILHDLTPGGEPAESSDVARVLQIALEESASLRQLKSHVHVQRVQDRLILRAATSADDGQGEWELSVPGTTEFAARGMTIETRLLHSESFAEVRPNLGGWVAAFDASVADSPLVLRTARAGDRIRPLGMTGSKKLSDLLIDAKWPRIQRGDVLVLERGEHGNDGPREIVWVPGLRVCDHFKVTNRTRTILHMELTGGPRGLVPDQK